MLIFIKKKSYEKLNKQAETFNASFKIDSLADKNEYSFPELREVYENLIDYYRKQSNPESQLLYLDKLLKLDSLLDNSNTISSDIIKKYDTPQLLKKKDDIINNLNSKERKNYYYIILLITIIIFLFFFLIHYRKKQVTYMKKYEMLFLEKKKITPTSSSALIPKISLNLPEDILNNIKKGLNKFENEFEFTDSSITMNKLSKQIGANSTYLSKVINHSKGVNFSSYLNDLRINYIVERLKLESKLRSYSIQAIAEEAGYNKAESFSKSFFKITGIYPSYFLNKLNKED